MLIRILYHYGIIPAREISGVVWKSLQMGTRTNFFVREHSIEFQSNPAYSHRSFQLWHESQVPRRCIAQLLNLGSAKSDTILPGHLLGKLN